MSILNSNAVSSNTVIEESLESLLETSTECLVECELQRTKTIEDLYRSTYNAYKYKNVDVIKEGLSLTGINISLLCTQYSRLLRKLSDRYDSVIKHEKSMYESAVDSFSKVKIAENFTTSTIPIITFKNNLSVPYKYYIDKLINEAVDNLSNQSYIDYIYNKRMGKDSNIFSNTKISNQIYTGKDKPTYYEYDNAATPFIVNDAPITEEMLKSISKQSKAFNEENQHIKKTIAYTMYTIEKIQSVFSKIDDGGFDISNLLTPMHYSRYNTVIMDYVNAFNHIIKTLYNIVIMKIQLIIKHYRQNTAILNLVVGKIKIYPESEVLTSDDRIELYRNV